MPSRSDSTGYQVWQFAWPVMISNITVPLLGLVDSAVLGRLPSPVYLGAVAVGGSLFSLIFWTFNFLRMGTSGLTSQAYGRNDGQALRDTLVQAMTLAVGLGLVLIFAGRPVMDLAMPFYQPSPEVVPEVYNYFLVRIWSAPATLANFAVLGWLLGRQIAKAPLIILVLQNSLNIILNLVFVLGLGMAVKGVALATVISEYASLALGLWLCAHYMAGVSGELRLKPALKLSAMKTLLMVNRRLFVRSLCLLMTMSLFTAWGARQGDMVLAANALLMNFVMLTSSALDGFAFAAEALIGKAAGAMNVREVRRILRSTLVCSVVMSVVISLVYWLFGHQLLAFMTDIDGLAEQAARYLPWLVIMPLAGVLSFWLDGVYIGLNRTGLMQNIMVLSTFVIFIPLLYLMQDFGNEGLWLAFTVFTIARSSGMAMSFLPLYRRIRENRVVL